IASVHRDATMHPLLIFRVSSGQRQAPVTVLYGSGLKGWGGGALGCLSSRPDVVQRGRYMRNRTMSLGFPPFTKAVKWLVLINTGVYLLMLVLGVIARRLGNSLTIAGSLIPGAV